MLKLNVDNFTQSLSALKAYAPPFEGSKDDRGVKYLYENLYLPFINNAALRIGGIDLNAFTAEDVGDFEEFFDNVLCVQERTASIMRGSLCKLPPCVSKTKFI